MSARSIRHALVALTSVVVVGSAAWASTPLLGADAPAPSDDQGPARVVSDGQRAAYADRSGYRFVAAAEGSIRPADLNAQLVAAVDAVVPQPAVPAGRSVWDRLADCESGDWYDGVPQPGTARWDYGLTFSHGDIFEGGVNFHPQTWDAYKDPGMPGHAGRATREQQIAVAERVLADQGWGAWPVCSRKLGLR